MDKPAGHLNLQLGNTQVLKTVVSRLLDLTENQQEKESLQGHLEEIKKDEKAYQVAIDIASRERQTPTCTVLPEFGTDTCLPDAKQFKVPTFYGKPTSKNDINCITWLNRICEIIRIKRLTEEASLNLMYRHMGGEAMEVLDTARRDKVSFPELIRSLEVRFAELQHPDLARRELSRITQRPSETFGQLLSRIRAKARMATREDGARAMENELEMTKQQFISCLPQQVYYAFRESERARNARGEPDFNCNELYEEVCRIERSMDTSKLRAAEAPRHKRHTFLVEEDTSASEEEGSSDSESDAEEIDEAEVVNWIRRLRKHKKYKKRNLQSTKRKKYILNKFLKKRKSFKPTPAYQVNQVHSDAESDVEEYYVTDDEDGELVTFYIQKQKGKFSLKALDLKALNVDRNECARCGLEGHMCSSPKCPLGRDKITDKACILCRKGGHLPARCPKTGKQGARPKNLR
jgi:hypothetical protein